MLNISPEELAENAAQIQERLSEVVYKYERDGRLVLPARTIVAIRFTPLSIRFGRRNYNGNPLGYFLEHKDDYGGMSRAELASFDGGLYRVLRKHRQLSEAIPTTLRRTFGDPLQYFRENQDIYGGLTRKDLERFHKPLGNALRRKKQLSEAIPEVNPF